jgi:hypothetical protein
VLDTSGHPSVARPAGAPNLASAELALSPSFDPGGAP